MNRGFLGAILALLAVAGSAFASGEPDGSLRIWLDGEYLLWWLQPAPGPQPLLTTGPLTSPISAGSGIFSNSTSQLLTGNHGFEQGPYSGFRVNAGWIDNSDTFGVQGSYFQLTQRAVNIGIGSNATGNPLLARPIIDATTGNETVLFVSAPNAFNGSINIASTTALLGGDANLLWVVQRGCCDDDDLTSWFHVLTGFRYLRLREDLSIDQSTTVLPGGISFFNGQPVTAPGRVGVSDDFRMLNQFYGAQLGIQGGVTWWRFALNVTGKVALGSMREEANISGNTTANFFGGVQTTTGGLLAQSTNIGSHTRNMFAVVPEGNLTFTFEITPQVKLMLGYSFLYISNVARPGDQIDRTVNRAIVPSSEVFNPAAGGPARPAFSWTGTDFWAHGLNVGIGLRF